MEPGLSTFSRQHLKPLVSLRKCQYLEFLRRVEVNFQTVSAKAWQLDLIARIEHYLLKQRTGSWQDLIALVETV